MAAQMPPLGERDSSTVRLELDHTGKGTWTPAGTARINPLARTATWRVEMSEGHADTPYRVVYPLTTAGGTRDCVFEGTVRRDPADKPQIVDEADGEVVYTLRIQGKSFRPMVFKDGTCTVRIIDPDRNRKQVRKSLTPIPPDHPARETIIIDPR